MFHNLVASLISMYLLYETKAKFVISNVPQTYKEAVQTCEINHNGKLVGEADFDSVLPQLLLHINYWTNSYTSLSDWINYEGCFNSSILSELNFIDIFVQPHTVASCSEECRHSNLFALQGEKCWCLNGTVSNVEALNSSFCGYNCWMTSEREFCGGETAFSVYSKFSEAQESNVKYRRCSHYQCSSLDSNGTFQLAADYCNNTYSYICGGIQSPINAEKIQYNSAVERCREMESFVFNNESIDKEACGSEGLLYKKKGFWSSIHRYERLLSPSLNGLRQIDKSYRCQVIVVRNSVIHTSFVPCFSFEKLPFVCKTGSTSNIVSEAPSSSGQQQEDLSNSGLVVGVVILSVLTALCISVVVVLSKKRFQKRMKRKRTTKVTYNSNVISLEDALDNDEIERCERQFGRQQEEDDVQEQRYAATQGLNQDKAIEYDFVKSPDSDASNHNIYDNNDDGMYYEMTSEDNQQSDAMTKTEEPCVEPNDLRVSNNPLPEYLEGIYDTALATTVHENSIKKSKGKSSSAEIQQSKEVLDETEEMKNIPYEAMNPPEIREDNYKDMSGL